MHRILVAVLAVSLFVLPSTVLAGGLSVGPKVGVNFANFTGNDVEGEEMKIGAAIGGVLVYSFSDLISVQPELLYTMKGTLDEDDKAINLNYLEIPILAKFSFLTGDVRPIAFIGPALGILLSADWDGKSEAPAGPGGALIKVSDLVNSTDIGAVIGAGVEIGKLGPGTLTADLRYEMGLTTIASDKMKNDEGETADVKNSVISLMVGYLFSL